MSKLITKNDLKAIFDDILPMNVADEINDLKSAIEPTNMFAIQLHETSNITTSANSNSEGTATFTKSGYYPIGVVGYHTYWVSGSTATMNWYSLFVSARSNGSCTVSYAVRNTNTSSTTWKLNVHILWMKL